MNREPGAYRNCSLGRVGGTGGCDTKALGCTKENGLGKTRRQKRIAAAK